MTKLNIVLLIRFNGVSLTENSIVWSCLSLFCSSLNKRICLLVPLVLLFRIFSSVLESNHTVLMIINNFHLQKFSLKKTTVISRKEKYKVPFKYHPF